MDAARNTDSVIIRTKRLILSPFVPTDVPALLEVFQDADVRRYLLDDQLVDQAWVSEEVTQSQQRFAEGSIGIWSIRAQRSPETSSDIGPIIGFTGFRPFFDPPELQLIYGLVASAWGAGFATESAGAAMEYAFESAGVPTVVAATDLPNVASVRVMERLGMQHDRVTDDGEQGTVFYRLDCNQKRGSDSFR